MDQNMQSRIQQGMELQQQGRLDEAAQYYAEALQADPQHPAALQLLGLVHHAKGEHAKAIELLQQSLAIQSQQPTTWCNLGVILKEAGEPQKAAEALERATVLKPDFAKAWLQKGHALMSVGSFKRAMNAYEEAIKYTDSNPQLNYFVAEAAYKAGMLDKAAGSYAKAIALKADYGPAHNGLGNVHRSKGELEEAIACYKTAREYLPNEAAVHMNLGVVEVERGNKEQAVANIERALSIQPNMPEAWRELAFAKRFKDVSDPHIAEMKSLFDAADSAAIILHVGFALGKAYDDLREYEKAMEHYIAANIEKKREYIDYDASKDTAYAEHMIAAYDNAFMADTPSAAVAGTDKAVLVVGMPRSGTSLLEQILATHVDVVGAGELDAWNNLVKELCDTHHCTLPDLAAKLTQTQLDDVAQAYLKVLEGKGGESNYVVDKMPGNFRYLGLITKALPEARIIHCRRDPMDTCTSIFKQYFAAPQPFSYAQEDIALYYRAYQKLMVHWKTLLPETQFHEVRYEALTREPEATTRSLFGFLGLEWSEGCLTFYKAKGTVQTASAAQVRSPLYTTSVGASKHYGSALDVMRQALE